MNAAMLCCHVREVAKRSAMAASRFLGAMAACVILLLFAAEHRKSHWNGCMKVAIVVSIIFLHFGACDFPTTSL